MPPLSIISEWFNIHHRNYTFQLTFRFMTVPSVLKNLTIYFSIFSVNTSSTFSTGLTFEGLYSITSLPTELFIALGVFGRKSSTFAIISFTLISFDGMVVADSIPSDNSHTGVVVGTENNYWKWYLTVSFINKTIFYFPLESMNENHLSIWKSTSFKISQNCFNADTFKLTNMIHTLMIWRFLVPYSSFFFLLERKH